MCRSLDKSSTRKSFLGSGGVLLILPPDICLIGSMHLSLGRWEDSGAILCQVRFPCFAGQHVSSLVPRSLLLAVRIPSLLRFFLRRSAPYTSASQTHPILPRPSALITIPPPSKPHTYPKSHIFPSPPTTSLPPRFSQPEPPTPSPEATPPMRPPTPPSRS